MLFLYRIMDKRTGVLRVEVGEQLLFLAPSEYVVDPGVRNGVNIDEVSLLFLFLF